MASFWLILFFPIAELVILSNCKLIFSNFRHYQFDADSTIINPMDHQIIIHNEHITLSLINASFILNNKIALNWNIDTDWNEITIISNTYHINDDKSHRRRLSDIDDYTRWNDWDHTTEHHKKSGRFIGESKYKRRFDDAVSMCSEYYSALASIRNSAENEECKALCNRLGDGTSCWIGLRAQHKKSLSKTKEWLDHHPVAYNNWSPNKPSNDKRKQCTEMYKNGLWNNVNCNAKRYAICEQVSSLPCTSVHHGIRRMHIAK